MPDRVLNHRSPMERAMAGRVQPFRQLAAESAPVAGRLDLTHPVEVAPAAHHISQAVIAALEAGETRYTARTGIEPLRRAIAEYSTAEGFPATQETCVVTNGGSEGLFIALQSLVANGDRVVLVEPAAPDLVALIEFIGGEVVLEPGLPLSSLDGAGAVVLRAACGVDGTRVPDELLADLLERASGQGVAVILDRSAVPDCYEPLPPFSRPDLAAEIVTVGSFSGAFGLDGWRAGYFTAPERLLPKLAGLKESMSISTTTPSQFAMLSAIENVVEVLGSARSAAQARRDLVVGLLQAHGIAFRMPEVYPGMLIDVRQTGMADGEVAHQLETERGVRVESGSVLGTPLDGYIRINLSAPEETLRAGVEQIAQFLVERTR